MICDIWLRLVVGNNGTEKNRKRKHQEIKDKQTDGANYNNPEELEFIYQTFSGLTEGEKPQNLFEVLLSVGGEAAWYWEKAQHTRTK